MRIATFNLENLFRRPVALNQDTKKKGQPYIDAYGDITKLLDKPVYSDSDKDRIVELLKKLELDNTRKESSWAVVRQNRGHLYTVSKNGDVNIKADGRDKWEGWVELKTELVAKTATKMTAKVIEEIQPDILAVEEAEGRDVLLHFNSALLHANPYEHVMSVRGNDDRPIDVGLLTQNGYAIESIVSHVDERYVTKEGKKEKLFSRDCAEYTVRAGDQTILVMVNHLKSQIGDSKKIHKARDHRLEQAKAVRKIYDERRKEGHDLIVILGDFNDSPTSDALAPLLKNGSDLRDISTHPKFTSDGLPGTYGTAKKAKDKFDYILLSPALFAKVTGGGVLRKGVWAPKTFKPFEEMHSEVDAASDHAAIYADIAI